MPRVDFYIVSDSSATAHLVVACRLAEKAWGGGHRVYIHAPSAVAAQQLDDLLWTFRADTFVPHGRYGADADGTTPILIGSNGDRGEFGEVLINLCEASPAFHGRFQRVAEVVAADEGARAAGRERFRFYREQGYALDLHNL